MTNTMTHIKSPATQPPQQGLTYRRRQRGFTLMEVLISMIVLSIGLLGLANLQMKGLKNNNSSYQRTQASLLAIEMIDRIRANRPGMLLGHYNDISGAAPADPGCISSSCNLQQLANYDAFLWSGSLTDRLPYGTGSVAGSGVDSLFTVTVSWDDNRSGQVDTSLVMSTTL